MIDVIYFYFLNLVVRTGFEPVCEPSEDT
jgi:hypothetical protein